MSKRISRTVTEWNRFIDDLNAEILEKTSEVPEECWSVIGQIDDRLDGEHEGDTLIWITFDDAEVDAVNALDIDGVTL